MMWSALFAARSLPLRQATLDLLPWNHDRFADRALDSLAQAVSKLCEVGRKLGVIVRTLVNSRNLFSKGYSDLSEEKETMPD